MAGNTFHLIIASVGEMHFDGAVVSATMPGIDGEFTIMPHHEPFVSILRSGTITVKRGEVGPASFPIEGGVVECSGARAVVLL